MLWLRYKKIIFDHAFLSRGLPKVYVILLFFDFFLFFFFNNKKW